MSLLHPSGTRVPRGALYPGEDLQWPVISTNAYPLHPAHTRYPGPTLFPGGAAPQTFSGNVGELASLPWALAQSLLGLNRRPGGTAEGVLGWHGVNFDPQRGSVAVVNPDGALSELAGEVIVITARSAEARERSAVVYVHAYGPIFEDLSVSRDVFVHLGPLSADSLAATVQILESA